MTLGRKRSNLLATKRRTAARSTFQTLTRNRSMVAQPRDTLRPVSKFGASPSLRAALPPAPLRITMDPSTWPRSSHLGAAGIGGGKVSLTPGNPSLNPHPLPGVTRITLEAAAWPRSSTLASHKSLARTPAAEPIRLSAAAVPRATRVKFDAPGLAFEAGRGDSGAAIGGAGIHGSGGGGSGGNEDEHALLLPHMAQPAEHLAVTIGGQNT